MFSTGLYVRSPRWLQEKLISGRDGFRKILREGRQYRNLVEQAMERDRWSRSDLQKFQCENLRAIVSYAYQHVPYYRSAFEAAGVNIDALDLPAEMARLPLISKQTILSAGSAMLSDTKKVVRFKGSTSGTTGSPVAIFQDLRAISAEKAFLTRQLTWAGHRQGDRQAWIRGEMVVPSADVRGPFWRMNRVENMLMMSSYHLAERTAESYLETLAEFCPGTIQAYPSSITFLARYLESRNKYFKSSGLRSIVTSSETFSDGDRRTVEERFQCRIFDWYGAFERVAAIGTCEQAAYHLLTDYSFVELQDVGNGMFEIIGTGFNNRVMPLVRYRTGDFVEMSAVETQCSCGRHFPVVNRIIGRQDDYIQLDDGRRIGRMDHVFKGMSGIAEAQIIQDKVDSIRVLIVPLRPLFATEQDQLVQNIHERTGTNVRVTLEMVSSIQRTQNGKFRAVISHVEQKK